jgi:hypothetical protein
MLADAPGPAVDTRPEDLRVSFDAPPLAPVATCRVAGVELRILSASHQVVLPGHVETIACGLGSGVPVGRGGTFRRDGFTLDVSVDRLGVGAFAAAASGWRARAGEGDDVLAVRFPGHPDALTALALRHDGWEGVHLYPRPGGGGTVVRARTTAPAHRGAAPATVGGGA